METTAYCTFFANTPDSSPELRVWNRTSRGDYEVPLQVLVWLCKIRNRSPRDVRQEIPLLIARDAIGLFSPRLP